MWHKITKILPLSLGKAVLFREVGVQNASQIRAVKLLDRSAIFCRAIHCPAALIAVLFIGLAPQSSFALDEDEIYRFEPCFNFRDKDGNAPQISHSLANQLSSPTNFPPWGTPLAPYVQALNRHQSRIEQKCENSASPPLTPFPPLMRSVSMVAQKTADLIRRDLESQKRDMKTVSECLKTRTSQHGDARCQKISNFLVADLSERIKKLRLYMALKDGRYTPGTPLEHDLPYTRFLSGLLFPTQKSWKEKLPPLSTDELATLAEQSRSLPKGRSAADLYDQMLSTTPILLLLDEPISPEKLATAVDLLLEGYPKKFPFEDLGQEVFLQTPYVARAIAELPQDEQFNACLSTKALFRNLKIQYEKVPRSLAGLALLTSIPTGAIGMGAKVFFQQLMSRSAWSISGLTGVQVATMSRRYLDGMRYCSALYRQKNPTPDVDGLCTFGKMNQLHSDAEIMTLINAGLFGAMKSAPLMFPILRAK